LSGNTLYVVIQQTGTVNAYDPTSGAAINATETGSVVTAVDGTATVTFSPPFSQTPIVSLQGVPSNVTAIVTSVTTTGLVVNASLNRLAFRPTNL
jgi:hypothetical protein